VQNASKASLKRLLFEDLGIEVLNEDDYQRGMKEFRKYLVESRLNQYRPRIVQSGLHFTVSVEYNARVALVSVRNILPLLAIEAKRIREKFANSRGLDNLYDFYMKYGDATEGAGMGIAMVEILLNQAGIHRHNFTIFTEPGTGHTVARVVLPLTEDYVPPR